MSDVSWRSTTDGVHEVLKMTDMKLQNMKLPDIIYYFADAAVAVDSLWFTGI